MDILHTVLDEIEVSCCLEKLVTERLLLRVAVDAKKLIEVRPLVAPPLELREQVEVSRPVVRMQALIEPAVRQMPPETLARTHNGGDVEALSVEGNKHATSSNEPLHVFGELLEVLVVLSLGVHDGTRHVLLRNDGVKDDAHDAAVVHVRAHLPVHPLVVGALVLRGLVRVPLLEQLPKVVVRLGFDVENSVHDSFLDCEKNKKTQVKNLRFSAHFTKGVWSLLCHRSCYV